MKIVAAFKAPDNADTLLYNNGVIKKIKDDNVNYSKFAELPKKQQIKFISHCILIVEICRNLIWNHI